MYYFTHKHKLFREQFECKLYILRPNIAYPIENVYKWCIYYSVKHLKNTYQFIIFKNMKIIICSNMRLNKSDF